MSFEALGLSGQADEREVRRAYARLLKVNRPDDDPAAFQALHEAYQHCLQQLRNQRWEDEQDAMEAEGAAPASHAPLPLPGERVEALPEPAPVPEGLPLPSPPQAAQNEEDDPAFERLRFDFTAFIDALFVQVRQPDAARLSAWLYSLPELYSIQLKSAITVDVLRAVVESDEPVGAAQIRAIGDFFGVNQLGPRDWWLVERMEQAQHRAEQHARFRSGQLPRSQPGEERAIERMMDAELASARWTWRMLPLSVVPFLPTRTRDRILELDELTYGVSEALIEPRRRAWFMELADRSRISAKRLGLSLLRTLVFGSLFLVAHRLLIGTFGKELPMLVAVIGGAMLAWQLLTALYLKLKQHLTVRGLDKYLREGLVLSFVAVALVAGALGAEFLPFSLSIVAVFYAATRHRAMEAGLMGFLLGVGDAVLTAPEGVTWPFPPALAGLCLAACLVLAVDRLRGWRTGLPPEIVVTDGKWLRRTAGICFGALAAGFVLLLTLTLR